MTRREFRELVLESLTNSPGLQALGIDAVMLDGSKESAALLESDLREAGDGSVLAVSQIATGTPLNQARGVNVLARKCTILLILRINREHANAPELDDAADAVIAAIYGQNHGKGRNGIELEKETLVEDARGLLSVQFEFSATCHLEIEQ